VVVVVELGTVPLAVKAVLVAAAAAQADLLVLAQVRV
jgi:hypothetical protein